MTDLTLVEAARVVFKPAKQKKDSGQKTPMGDKPSNGRQEPADKTDALVERLKELWENYGGKVIEPETIAALIDEFAAIAATATIGTIKELWSDVCKEFYPF
jgi:hypothetical protein